MKRNDIFLNAVIAVMVLVGALTAFIGTGLPVLRFYTVLSNLFAGAVSAAYVFFAVRGNIPSCIKFLRLASTACLGVTMLVVITILTPMSYGSPNAVFRLYLGGANTLFHVPVPVLSILSFVFFEKGHIPKSYIFYSLIPTIIYAVVTIPLNALNIMRGPYPFLLVNEQPWYMTIVWIIVVFAIDIAVIALLRALHNRRNRP